MSPDKIKASTGCVTETPAVNKKEEEKKKEKKGWGWGGGGKTRQTPQI